MSGHWLDKVIDILNAETNDLRALARIAGEDPATFYRGVSLADVDASRQDVSGMEFAEKRTRPSDFDMNKAREMILSGVAPPKTWARWIRDLDLSDSNIEDVLPLLGFSELKELNLSRSKIKDTTRAERLTDRQLEDFVGSLSQKSKKGRFKYFYKAVMIEKKKFGVARFTIEVLSSLRSLMKLSISGTKISETRDINNIKMLESLDISETDVASIFYISRIKRLKLLKIGSTRIKNVTLISRLKNLKLLDLSRTLVSDVSALSGLTALETLDLTRTPVSDVSALSGLTALQRLNLEGTLVSDVSALSGLTALQTLDLTGTQVRSLAPLVALENLNKVYVSKSDRAAIAKTHPRGADIVKVRE